MTLTAPEYYGRFKCIADKCTHSCCIGWEIDIDSDTMDKYTALSGGYAENIRASIDDGEIPHFRLGTDERCPHLDESGLCRIICEHGEGYLCDICREHPRFYNETAHGLEVGLGMACEEACRMILGSDDYDKMAVIKEDSEVFDPPEFDAVPHRERIFSMLRRDDIHYSQKTAQISREYNVSVTTLTDAEWRALLCSLEYLDEAHRELFSRYSSDTVPSKHTEKALERALAYFVYRHVTGAWDEESLRARVGFSLLCTALLASVAASGDIDPVTAARIISEEIEYSEDNTDTLTEIFI